VRINISFPCSPTKSVIVDTFRTSKDRLVFSKLSYQLLALVLIALALLPEISRATELPVPRLWRVSSTTDSRGTVIYILAISHPGSELEYDGYLNTKVIPAFLAADVFHCEDGGVLTTNGQPACAHELSDPDDIATLRRARDMVGRGAVEYFRLLSKFLPPPVPDENQILRDAAEFTRGLSEFSVVETLRAQYIYIEAQKPAAATEGAAYPYRPIVDYLMRLRPQIKIESMDRPTDLAHAYCSAGELRAGIISMYMQIYDFDRIDEKPVESIDLKTKEINEKLKSALSEKSVKLDLYESALTCSRTQLWAQRFNTLLDGKIHFLALGAAHLFPSSGPVTSCPGLLTDLRRRGFMVETIR
jgi:hypothetical protein